jgi:hypothetical protein
MADVMAQMRARNAEIDARDPDLAREIRAQRALVESEVAFETEGKIADRAIVESPAVLQTPDGRLDRLHRGVRQSDRSDLRPQGSPLHRGRGGPGSGVLSRRRRIAHRPGHPDHAVGRDRPRRLGGGHRLSGPRRPDSRPRADGQDLLQPLRQETARAGGHPWCGPDGGEARLHHARRKLGVCTDRARHRRGDRTALRRHLSHGEPGGPERGRSPRRGHGLRSRVTRWTTRGTRT